MECNKEKIYFLVESLRRCNMSPSEISRFIEQSWPEHRLTTRRVQQLCSEFESGERTSFTRSSGSGKPKCAVRVENKERIQELIDEDKTISTREIAFRIGINQSMAVRILNEDLNLKWLHTRWVPHKLTEDNKIIRVERCTDMLEAFKSRQTRKNLVTIDEKNFFLRNLKPRNVIGSWEKVGPYGDCEENSRLQTPRRSPMEAKYMVIVAVSQSGTHYYEILNRNESMNSVRYVQFLTNLGEVLRNAPTPILLENTRLCQDNARPHTSHATMAFIHDKNIRIIKQAPYSPDTNLCDRYIFPRLEAKRNADFDSYEDLKTFLDNELPLFTKDRMQRALIEMENDLKKIVEQDGSYNV